MRVAAFDGPAGSGKTHRLMDELLAELGRRPLAAHQRVLAVTFMHGSRRRLDERLRGVIGRARNFEATTLDSFAWRLTQRWRRLALHLGQALPAQDEFDRCCELAAELLGHQQVQTWVAATYPICLVDEAQDLSAARSSMVAALAQSGTVLLAYDEFQCLNTALLPISVEGWLREHCEPVTLEGCRRTDDAELLDAARALRNAQAVNLKGRRFKVMATPSIPLAATCLANAIAWRNGGNVAVLTPSRRGGFSDNIVASVGAGPLGKRQNGPFAIEWEGGDEEDKFRLVGLLGLGERCVVDDVLTAIADHAGEPLLKGLKEWLLRQRSVRGIQDLPGADLERQIDRLLAHRRSYGHRSQADFLATTIQQAKNREFEHVVVIWPYTVPADDEQRRRLLYNAITRAKRSCTVLVQAKEMLDSPPFAVH